MSRFLLYSSAVPIRNLSSEIEYSQDSKIAINLKESRRGINHLICLGKGELKGQTGGASVRSVGQWQYTAG